MSPGVYIAIGIAIGAAIGVAINNAYIGIGIGVAAAGLWYFGGRAWASRRRP